MRAVLLLTALCVPLMAAREVAITIDDLPRGGDVVKPSAADTFAMTRKLLAPIRAANVPITAFVTECRTGLDRNSLRELLMLWKAAGAELGNHTCSHLDFNTTTLSDFENDTDRGAGLITEVLGHAPRYFRFPMLHAGPTEEKKAGMAEFLERRGYRNAPVTLDNSDWLLAAVYGDALRRGDEDLARRVREAYVPYMESIFAFFEERSREVAGHEMRQVLLMHANQLNADAMPDLLAMMKRRGYALVSLDRALEDPGYGMAESYLGKGGFSWVHRWSRTKGMEAKGEPDEPEWIQREYEAISKGRR